MAGRPGRIQATGSTQDTASKFARDAGAEFQKFAKKHDLEGLGKKAAQQAQSAFGEFQVNAKRTFVKLDSEYSISDKAQKAARKAEEAAKDLDQKYSVRRRIRGAVETVQRKWPVWSKQFSEFSETWYGKVVIILGVFLLFSSAIFWKVINFVLLLWWLSVPLSFLAIDVIRRQQAERVAAQERARQRAANPFADMFRASTSSYASSGYSSRGTSAGGSSRSYRQQDGPVIDAEWTSLDEDGSPRKK